MSPTLADLQRHNLRMVAVHVAAEFGNRVPEIVATITPECRYPLLHRGDDGSLRLDVITDLDGARRYYGAMRQGLDIVASRQIRRITTDWYVFNHSIATMRHTGSIGGIAATGAEHYIQSTTLFPVTEDGILGEVPWNRHTWREIVSGVPQREPRPDDPIAVQLRASDALEAYVAALRSGDPALLDGVITPDFRVATRNYVHGGGPMLVSETAAQAAENLRSLHRAVEVVDVTVVNRVADEWFVFGELLWRLRSRDRSAVDIEGEFDLRTAAIHPVDGRGRLVAELGYGTDLPLRSGGLPIAPAAAAAGR
jgi:hypothetical protein